MREINIIEQINLFNKDLNDLINYFRPYKNIFES